MDLNINPADVTELAAKKVADAVLGEHPDLYDMINLRIEETLNSLVSEETKASMLKTIDQKFAEETEKVLSEKIIPLDIWGKAVGEPTTIREQIHKRALEYWEERVEPDRNNKGLPRS